MRYKGRARGLVGHNCFYNFRCSKNGRLTMGSSSITPIRKACGIYIKLEAFNPGGSHKTRAARHMVEQAVREHGLRQNDSRRLLEKTGGNLGVGLAFAARRYGVSVDLVVGLSFSPVKRAVCEIYGAHLVGQDLLAAGMPPREVIAHFLQTNPGRYIFTDQFNNPANLAAHETETGPELAMQLRELNVLGAGRVIFVTGAGTGASFTGVARTLRKQSEDVECVLVLPSGCDLDRGIFREHALEGTAVGVVPPFLDQSIVSRTMWVCDEEARLGQTLLAREAGFFPGVSSGANYFACLKIAEGSPNTAIVTIAYDAGEAYVARSSAA
jgi:cysteine synthase